MYDILNLLPTIIIEKKTPAALTEFPSRGVDRPTAEFFSKEISKNDYLVKFSDGVSLMSSFELPSREFVRGEAAKMTEKKTTTAKTENLSRGVRRKTAVLFEDNLPENDAYVKLSRGAFRICSEQSV